MPKVNVIITTYNRANLVCQAIESVLEQTYQDVEIILVDDGSTDDTKDVLHSYIKKNQIVYHYQSNQGLSAARNKGIRLSKGQYLKFLDNDDFLYEKQIELQVKDLEENHTDISISDYHALLENGILEENRHVIDLQEPLLSFIQNNKTCVHAVLMRKEWLEKVGGFDEHLKACEDYDLWFRMILEGAKISKIDYIGCCYRFLSSSMTTDYNTMFFNKMVVFEKLNKELLQRQINITPPFRKRLWLSNMKLLHECLLRKYDMNQYSVHMMQMMEQIYLQDRKFLKWLFIKLFRMKAYVYLQFYRTCLKNWNYKADLLQRGVLWRQTPALN